MLRLSVVLLLALSGCRDPISSPTYTLYREGLIPERGRIERIHMATFDADQPGEYNRENCFIARDLFQAQPGVQVRYWCELGQYRK